MINNVVLVGRLTNDVELKKTQSGTSVVTFYLAVQRKHKQEGQQDSDFIRCVAWSKTADLMYQYLSKGSLIGVEGHIQTRFYDNQQGQRVYVTEVVCNGVQFLESRKDREQNKVTQQEVVEEQQEVFEEQSGEYGDLPF